MAATASSSPLTTNTTLASLSPRSSPSAAAAAAAAAGGEQKSSALESQPEIFDNGGSSGDGSNGGNKKPAWNKPSNGSIESGGSVVMGADSWPALSESTMAKASPKLSPSDSGSVSPPQLVGIGSSMSPSQSSLVTHKLATSSANHSPTSNHGRTTRQKSMKRESGGNGNANGGFPHQSALPVEGSHTHNSSSAKSGGGSENSGRDNNAQNHGNRESGLRNAGGDHPRQPHNSFRRGNGGLHSHGDGSHQNYGGRRRDQDCGNHNWNHQRSFNGRDAPPMQPRVGPRGFVRTPPVSAPFVHHAPVRPLMNPMGMPDMHMIYLPPGMPFVAPMTPPVYFPAPDPQLHSKIVNQIDYYFSDENLIKDIYLRQNMDEHGWVPVALIASFKKVMQLTDNIQLILDAVQSSTVVEAQGDKIRKRDDWVRWIMPPSVQFPTASGSESPKMSNVASLSAHVQTIVLDEKTSPKRHVDVHAAMLRSSSRDFSTSRATADGASPSCC